MVLACARDVARSAANVTASTTSMATAINADRRFFCNIFLPLDRAIPDAETDPSRACLEPANELRPRSRSSHRGARARAMVDAKRPSRKATPRGPRALARDADSAIRQMLFAQAAPQALVEVLDEGPPHVRATGAFVLRLVPALAAVEALDHGARLRPGRVGRYPLTG